MRKEGHTRATRCSNRQRSRRYPKGRAPCIALGNLWISQQRCAFFGDHRDNSCRILGTFSPGLAITTRMESDSPVGRGASCHTLDYVKAADRTERFGAMPSRPGASSTSVRHEPARDVGKMSYPQPDRAVGSRVGPREWGRNIMCDCASAGGVGIPRCPVRCA
jgi:hypothetical protein